MKDEQWLLIKQISYTMNQLVKLFDDIIEKHHNITRYDLEKIKDSFKTLDRLHALFFNTKPNWFMRWLVSRRHKQTISMIKRVEELEDMVKW